MKYEEMRPHQIEKVLREKPIAYIAWGAHEWHGPHNAIGLDAIKAYNQCLALCEKTGGVVLPPVYCGYQTMKPARGFGHTLEFSKTLVRDLLFEHLEQLYDEGFRVMIVVMGHYGGKHQETIQEAVSLFQERHHMPRAWAFPDYEPTSEDGFSGDHAGKNETSLLLHFRPDLVDMEQLPDQIERYRIGIGGQGDVREASAEQGRQMVESLVRNAVPRIEALLEEANEQYRNRYGESCD
ncbi:MAG: creatininase family protein [Candidatus Sumerlaeia bacterium]